MTERLKNKVAVITGAGSEYGIGRATALLFAKEGARVVIADINETASNEVTRLIIENGGVAIPILCDVTNIEQVKSMLKNTLDEFGTIDILVNTAANYRDISIVKMQEKMVEYALGVKGIFKSKMACINLLYNITKNCDCMSKNEDSIVPDVGIIGGMDPLAVDKASLDLVGIDTIRKIHPEVDPLIQIRHAEKIKLGSSQYEMREI